MTGHAPEKVEVSPHDPRGAWVAAQKRYRYGVSPASPHTTSRPSAAGRSSSRRPSQSIQAASGAA